MCKETLFSSLFFFFKLYLSEEVIFICCATKAYSLLFQNHSPIINIHIGPISDLTKTSTLAKQD